MDAYSYDDAYFTSVQLYLMMFFCQHFHLGLSN